MGARGPKPEPTKLKLLKGNPGRRPINDREPQPLRTIPECPSFLNEEEKKIWDKVSRKLYDMGVLTEVDDLALGVFCEYFLEYLKLSDQAKKAGLFIKVKHGRETKTFVDPETGKEVTKEVDRYVLHRSPLATARDKAWTIASRILADFGMNPSARTRLKMELEQASLNSYEAFRERNIKHPQLD